MYHTTATGSLILKGPDPVLFLVSDFLLLGGETTDRCLFHCRSGESDRALDGTSDVGHDSVVITQCVE